jgi:energy coupling factor transporter S component ThiW
MRTGAAHGQHSLRGYSGPGFGVGTAFAASLLRNLFGLGSLMAFPGSMFGALLCGLVYRKSGKLVPTLLAEVFGTAVLGGLTAYPIAVLFMGSVAGELAFYAYVLPFFFSTAGGAAIAGILLFSLQKNGLLGRMAQQVK